jgi:hypothetical protein
MARVDERDKGDEPQLFWAAFTHDPRLPANAGLRASDRDRDVAHHQIGEAYADGRLDRAELDERTARVQAARTLGELPDLVADLVAPEATRVPGLLGPTELRARGERHFASERRDALLRMLVPSLVCVVVWLLTSGFGGFFWPGFVILGTGINLVQTVVRREDIVEGHVRKLEKRQRRELEGRPDDPQRDAGGSTE